MCFSEFHSKVLAFGEGSTVPSALAGLRDEEPGRQRAKDEERGGAESSHRGPTAALGGGETDGRGGRSWKST